MSSSRSSVAMGMEDEVSSTAQGLLQAHRERSSSAAARQLEAIEESLAVLDSVHERLVNRTRLGQQVQSSGKTSGSDILQPVGGLAFWPARLVDKTEVYIRQTPEGLSLPDQLALDRTPLPSTSSSGASDFTVPTKLSNPNRTLDVKYVKTGVRDAAAQLASRRRQLQISASALRPPSETSTEEPATMGKHVVNEDDQALNEEGLPFFEPIEKVSDQDSGSSAPAYLQPFVSSKADKTQRKLWMDDVLSQLEQEEEAEEGAASNEEAVPADQEFRVVLRARTPSPPPEADSDIPARILPEIVSATRPPPPKSALKVNVADRPPIVQRPSFGSTAIRRGFLNLNPSSPGALQSSYTLEELEKDMPKHDVDDRPSRSQTPVQRALPSFSPMNGSSPMASGTSTPSRKSVRIKSPERAHPDASNHVGLTPLQRALKSSIRVKEKDLTPQVPSSHAPLLSSLQRSDSGSGTAEKRHKDDIGVEQEAERIVNLLGPAVIEGHPSAPPSDVLLKMQQAHEEDQKTSTPEAIAERAKLEEEQRRAEHARRLQEKPALGQAVMERTPVNVSEKGAKPMSGFKKGFLNQKPPKFVPNRPSRTTSTAQIGNSALPEGPSRSLGMSALDRASLADDDLEKRRVRTGLPAAVPHARPSKAYAEKMQRKQAGLDETSSNTNVEQGESQTLARPMGSDDVPRPGRVRFGAPQTENDADDEDHPDTHPSSMLDNYNGENVGEVDEEEEEPKITGEGADADDDDDYYDSYLNKRGEELDREGEGREDNDDDDLDWDVHTEDELDEDDFDYDPEDLLALAPEMDADQLALSGNDALLREYAEAKARLEALGLSLPTSSAEGRSQAPIDYASEDSDYVDDIVPLDASVDDPEYQGNTASDTNAPRSRISRFKASLNPQQGKTNGKAKVSTPEDLVAMFQSARNLGQKSDSDQPWANMDGVEAQQSGAPVMIIPQLAPVRFPKNGPPLTGEPSKAVDLDGASSDDDDEKAELNMRSRLDRLEWQQNNPEQARKLAETRKLQRQLDQGIAPPHITHRQTAANDSVPEKEAAPQQQQQQQQEEEVKPKRVSRFKASRMA